MKVSIFAGLALACICFSPVVSRAAKNAGLLPQADRFGELRIEDRFDGDKLDSDWIVTKGTWQVVDGTLVGQEEPADKHAAVLTLKKPNRNSAIKFSFQLNGINTFTLSLNHARGHLFRVVIREDSVAIVKDKNKRDPQSRVKQLAKSPAAFEPSAWYTLLVEIDGDKVSVRTDNDITVSASDPSLNVDKPSYRFVTRGKSLALDDLLVWDSKD